MQARRFIGCHDSACRTRGAVSGCGIGRRAFTAIKAGFPAERIHFHGNNKSPEELAMALEHQIGCIVLDNFHEIAITEDLCKRSGQTVDVCSESLRELKRTRTIILRRGRKIPNSV
ncbi:hypothetical protein PO124_32385 [Bacillus licheniformis]|nr:hypothetical protein [Bacillus licheniformis]